MKRKALMVALFCIMGLMLAGSAQATDYTCSVSRVGVIGGGYYVVYLKDTATSNPGWTGTIPFLIPDSRNGVSQAITNAMLAAALTAYANGTEVIADIYNPTPPAPQYSVIAGLCAAKPITP